MNEAYIAQVVGETIIKLKYPGHTSIGFSRKKILTVNSDGDLTHTGMVDLDIMFPDPNKKVIVSIVVNIIEQK